MTITWNLARAAICAAALVVSVDAASAAPARVASNTNLRSGPGTNFGIITTVPGGAVVNVIRCTAAWCNVLWQGRPGYMIARNLGRRAPAVVVGAPAPVVVVGPPVYYGRYYYGPGPYYWGPRFYYGPRWGRWRRW
jgi:uncharacterized protein YraI